MNVGTQQSLYVLNSTFVGNSANTAGAISSTNPKSSTYVTCCTITGNNATASGGGVNSLDGTLRIYNSIISGNSAPSSPNTGRVWPNGPASCLIDVDTTTIFTTGQLANNGGPTQTIALKPGGPAVNAGTTGDPYDTDQSDITLTTDQRGKPRTIGSKLDIGAYEAPAATTLAATTISGVTSTAATIGGNVSSDGYGLVSKRGFVYAIASKNANPSIGGANVTESDIAGTAGAFTLGLSNLTPLTTYSVASFATNEIGTTYSPVVTFQTTEIPGTVVTTASDTVNPYDGQTSLREALTYANSTGSASLITFAPALAGQTIALTTGWNGASDTSALNVTGQVTIQGPLSSPGITIALDPALKRRHVYVFSGASLTVQNLTFTGGNVVDYGGAIWSQGSLTVRGCTFTGNSANEGGAVQSWGDSTLFVAENSTFSGNNSTGIAGAIDCGAASMALRYVTITNNTAAGGNALVIYKNALTAIDCLIAGNGSEGAGSANGGSFSPQSTNNLLGSGSTAGLMNAVNGNLTGVAASGLYLGALANNGGPTATIALLPGSPALNAGFPITGIDSDQRGGLRLVGSAPDIGAFEQVPVAAVTPQITPAAGSYTGSAQIGVSTTSTNAAIYYTLDGSVPTATHGTLYQGPFSLTTSATVTAVATGSGYLDSSVASATFTVLNPLQSWRALQGLAVDGSQDLADPSGDGIANLLKFAFNMAPNAGDLLLSNHSVLSASGTSGLPAITTDASGHLHIEFIRLKAASNPGITYTVETSADLGQFQLLDLSGATVTSIDDKWERVAISDPVVTPARFGRVRVSE